jgi:hypothetical protein
MVSWSGPQELPDALAAQKAKEERPGQAGGPTNGGEEAAEARPEGVTIKLEKATDKEPGPEDPKVPEERKAEVSFAHGEDYSWLRGEVEYSFLSKGWRLRYAPLGKEDKYGGSLTLVDGDLHNLRDGQLVHAQGFLVPGKDDRGHPRFRVLQMKRLGGPEDGTAAEGK